MTTLENQISENIEEWMKCWETQKFPLGKTFTYEEWRMFREWWYITYPELPLRVAFRAWLFEKSKYEPRTKV